MSGGEPKLTKRGEADYLARSRPMVLEDRWEALHESMRAAIAAYPENAEFHLLLARSLLPRSESEAAALVVGQWRLAGTTRRCL